MADKFKASLAGIDLEIRDIGDGLENAIVEHKFPYTQGSKLENQGQDTRRVRFKCYFWDNSTPGHPTYDDHFKIMELFKDSENLIELIHPKYGTINGFIKSTNIRNDDRQRTAEIDILFMEDLASETDLISLGQGAVDTVTTDEYVSLIAEQTEQLQEDIGDILTPSEALEVLGVEVDFDSPLIGQFSSISGKPRELINIADRYVTAFQAHLSSVTNPASSILTTVNFVTDLPGALIRAVALSAERVSLSFDGVKSSPNRFVGSFISSMNALKNTLPHPKGTVTASEANVSLNTSTPGTITDIQQEAITSFRRSIDICTVSRAALDTGSIFEEDEIARRNQKTLEQIKTFDTLGNRTEVDTGLPIITVQDIENTLKQINTEAQAVLDVSRNLQSLKNMVNALILHAKKVKIELENIKTITVGIETPLHLIMLSNGLDYKTAERVYSINEISNPNFTKGEISIYAR